MAVFHCGRAPAERPAQSVWGAYAAPRVVFGVSPNRVFRRDAGNLHARTRALPRPTSKGWPLFGKDL